MTFSTRQLVFIGGVFVLMLFVIAFLIGRVSNGAVSQNLIPTATRVVATSTPNLSIRAPHILAAWQSVTVPCDSCYQFTFTSNGPFDIVTACNPFQVFAGSFPALQVQVFNGNGHLLDTITKTCGDPNKDVVATNIIPESLPAGQYQLQMLPSGAPATVLVLDASQA